jgi:hypothetical protein
MKRRRYYYVILAVISIIVLITLGYYLSQSGVQKTAITSFTSVYTGTYSTYTQGIGTVFQPPKGANYSIGSEYPSGPRFVRIRAVNTEGYSVAKTLWSIPEYTAMQIIQMVGELHPQVLERMTQGVFNWTAPVLVCSSCSPMTYGQFLNASMNACECYIIPRLDILSAGSVQNFLAEAQYLLSVPVVPRFSMLSVDSWGLFCSTTNSCNCQFDQEIFQSLYSMGWKGIGVLFANPPYIGTCGWATFVDFDISTNISGSWTINQNFLSQIKADATVQKVLLYAPDFPTQAQQLLSTCTSSNHGCDQIENVLSYAASEQSQLGYSYVYTVVQNGQQVNWDATHFFSSNGTSIYDIMRNLMNSYD